MVVTLGLSKIEVGDIGADGGMGTSLSTLGLTYQDTCTMTQDDAETTEHYAEELDDPVVSISKAGKTNFAFSIMNADVDTLVKLLGGKKNGTSWEAPATLPTIEKSVRITPQQGLKFEIPRMKLVAKINATFSKSGILLLEVTGTVLAPTLATAAKMKATPLTAEK